MSSWTWRCEDSAGGRVEADVVPGGGFPSRAEAEAWLTEGWADLADAGVAQVTLCEDDREVYGPMSLAAG